MNPQLQGIEDIPGTYAFDVRTSYRAYRLNRFFWRMIDAGFRERLVADEEGTMAAEGLSEAERALVRARDWIGLVRYGVLFFVLEKFARVVRLSNMEVYASMRGESLEDFLKTRRVPGLR